MEDDDSDQEEDHDDDSVVDAEYEPGDSENDTSESSDTKLRKSVVSISPLIRIKRHQTKESLVVVLVCGVYY